MFYDRDGIPCPPEMFGELLEHNQVARTRVMDGAHPERSFDVSTVHLVIDHGFGFSDLPIIFETMVFAEDDPRDLRCVRYPTIRQARQGHTTVVVQLCNAMQDPIVMEEE